MTTINQEFLTVIMEENLPRWPLEPHKVLMDSGYCQAQKMEGFVSGTLLY